MPTKQFIFQRAIASFPEHYEYFIKKNPHLKLPKNFTTPSVTDLEVDYVNKEYGTAIEIHLTVKKKVQRENITFWLRGVCFSDEADADCVFFSGGPGTLRKFARIFAAHLIFNILSEHNIDITDWNNLPDK